MRYAEINRKFTELVTDYIAQGWNINSTTMSGSQGEVAKVDLTNCKDIVRLMIVKDNGHHDFYHDGYKVVVGRYTGEHGTDIKPNNYSNWGTLWNNDLDIISEECFYHAGYLARTDWFVSKEDARANYEKSIQRIVNRCYDMDVETDITDKAAKVVLPYVRRQKGCKTAKLSDVRVVKGTNHGKKYFLVICKGHRFVLK